MKNKITSHTVVFNEERWIWFSLTSVLPYVDRMIVFDMGSTDRTLEIIKKIDSPKIVLQSFPPYDPKKSVLLRTKMLEETQTEWFLIVDGDEVWYEKSIAGISSEIRKAKDDLWGIVTPTIIFLGDVYHVEEEAAGRYEFLGKKGHFAMRATRKIPGLRLGGTYPLEGYYTPEGKLINEIDKHLIFMDFPYCHMTNLIRSSDKEKDKSAFKRRFKREIGVRLPADFKYPEVFYLKRPTLVPSPWQKMDLIDVTIGLALTPLKKIKRRLI